MGNQRWPQYQNGIRERSIKDFMMNFRKRVTKSGKRTSFFMACHGNSVNNTKAIAKIFLKILRCICIHCKNFIPIEVAVKVLG